MKLTNKEVKHLAFLCRLKIEESDIEKLKKELSGISDWMDKLNNFSFEKTPEISPTEDVVIECPDSNAITEQQKKVLANAPNSQHNFFTVPKIIEE